MNSAPGRVVSFAARVLLGAVLLVAGAVKIPDAAGSVRAVRAYDLLPEVVVPALGYALPVIEVVCGVLLLLGVFTRAAAALGAILMVAFVIGIASAWARGLQIDCGCFGGGGFQADAASQYPWEIARDVALAACAIVVMVVPSLWRLESLWSTAARVSAHVDHRDDELEPQPRADQ